MEQKEERNFDYELESSFLEFGCGIRMGIVDVKWMLPRFFASL